MRWFGMISVIFVATQFQMGLVLRVVPLTWTSRFGDTRDYVTALIRYEFTYFKQDTTISRQEIRMSGNDW